MKRKKKHIISAIALIIVITGVLLIGSVKRSVERDSTVSIRSLSAGNNIYQINPKKEHMEQSEKEGFTYCNCEYDKKGNIQSLSYSWDSTMPEKKEVYTYEYGLSGRYSSIRYESYGSWGES